MAAATTSGRAAWIWEWMTNAAVFTGQSPSTTWPRSSTRMRSRTRINLKFIPSGLTQKWSGRRVAGRDVTGQALVEPEVAEQPEGGGEALLAMPAFVLDVVKRWEFCPKTGRTAPPSSYGAVTRMTTTPNVFPQRPSPRYSWLGDVPLPHSVSGRPPSPVPSVMDRWVIRSSVVAPCQCHSSEGVWTMSPWLGL